MRDLKVYQAVHGLEKEAVVKSIGRRAFDDLLLKKKFVRLKKPLEPVRKFLKKHPKSVGATLLAPLVGSAFIPPWTYMKDSERQAYNQSLEDSDEINPNLPLYGLAGLLLLAGAHNLHKQHKTEDEIEV